MGGYNRILLTRRLRLFKTVIDIQIQKRLNNKFLMMKILNRILSFIALSFFALQIQAQNVKITWGPETKFGSYTVLNKILAEDETGYYSLFTQYRGFWIFYLL